MSVLFLTRVDGGRIISARDGSGISRTRCTCRRVFLPLLFLDLHVRFCALQFPAQCAHRSAVRHLSPVRCVVWSVVIYVDFAISPCRQWLFASPRRGQVCRVRVLRRVWLLARRESDVGVTSVVYYVELGQRSFIMNHLYYRSGTRQRAEVQEAKGQ